jgi:hypothetical protein
MNKKQAVFLRRYSARMGKPMTELKREWNATPLPQRHALKERMTAYIEAVDAAMSANRKST